MSPVRRLTTTPAAPLSLIVTRPATEPRGTLTGCLGAVCAHRTIVKLRSVNRTAGRLRTEKLMTCLLLKGGAEVRASHHNGRAPQREAQTYGLRLPLLSASRFYC